jgi:6-phosphofructokinase 1
MLATKLGAGAAEQLAAGKSGVLVGISKGETIATPLSEVTSGRKPLDPRLLELARILAK